LRHPSAGAGDPGVAGASWDASRRSGAPPVSAVAHRGGTADYLGCLELVRRATRFGSGPSRWHCGLPRMPRVGPARHPLLWRRIEVASATTSNVSSWSGAPPAWAALIRAHV